MNLTGHQPRQRKPKNCGFTPAELKRYLDYIGGLGQVHGCILCRAPSIVAHVKYGEVCPECGGHAVDIDTGLTMECSACGHNGWRYGKVHGLRQHLWTLPLCPNHHTEAPGCQHSANEQQWWEAQGIDPLWLCTRLQDVYNASKSRADAIQSGLAVLENVR